MGCILPNLRMALVKILVIAWGVVCVVIWRGMCVNRNRVDGATGVGLGVELASGAREGLGAVACHVFEGLTELDVVLLKVWCIL